MLYRNQLTLVDQDFVRNYDCTAAADEPADAGNCLPGRAKISEPGAGEYNLTDVCGERDPDRLASPEHRHDTGEVKTHVDGDDEPDARGRVEKHDGGGRRITQGDRRPTAKSG